MTDLERARDLAKQFPREVAGFTLPQIASVWKEYSRSMGASWLGEDRETVEQVFDAAVERLL